MPPRYPGRAACLHCHHTHNLTTICHINDPMCYKRDKTIKGPCRYCYETYAFEYECHATDPNCRAKVPADQQPQFIERHAKTPWYIEIPRGYIHDPHAWGVQGAILVYPAGAPYESRPPGVDFVPPIRCIPYRPNGPSEMQLAVRRVEELRRKHYGRRIRARLEGEELSQGPEEFDQPIPRTMEEQITHQLDARDHERELCEAFYGPEIDFGPGFDLQAYGEYNVAMRTQQLKDNAMFKALWERQLLQARSGGLEREGAKLHASAEHLEAEREILSARLGERRELYRRQKLLDRLHEEVEKLDAPRASLEDIDEKRTEVDEGEDDEDLCSVSDRGDRGRERASEQEWDEASQYNEAQEGETRGSLNTLDPLLEQARSALQQAFDRVRTAEATHSVLALSTAPMAMAERLATLVETVQHVHAGVSELQSNRTPVGPAAAELSTSATHEHAAQKSYVDTILRKAHAVTAEITAMAEHFEAEARRAEHAAAAARAVGEREDQAGEGSGKAELKSTSADAEVLTSREKGRQQGRLASSQSPSKSKRKRSGGRKKK